MELRGKKIILGVTGSIAAYKAVNLLRLLVKEGAEVRVIMTETAKEFVGPVSFAALSGQAVLSDFFKSEGGEWNSHVDLGVNADLMLIAPVTATTLGKLATGIADNLLVTTYLSARCPVVLVPAMDMDMYTHPSTQKNLEILKSWGKLIIEPTSGELASGLEGKGRMVEPEEVLTFLKALDEGPSKKKLLNFKVLVTAGPTHENIDPVRFIGNHSSGKMGYAIATVFAEWGAEVELISGPVKLEVEHPGVKLTSVNTAAEMYEAALQKVDQCRIAIFTAAVADFTPDEVFSRKVKRGKEGWDLRLKPTKDIAADLGKSKRKDQFFVGFALETDNGKVNAMKKLKTKNLDLVVLNMAGEDGAGFGGDTNRVSMMDRSGGLYEYEQKPKPAVATDLVERVIKMIGDA